MNLSWKIPVAAVIIIFLVSLIGWAIYNAWDGSQEQWHDTGKVTWVSQRYFVTAGVLGGHWAENFTITTNWHGNLSFTTDYACQTEHAYHCGYLFTQAPPSLHLGDLVGLIHHRDNSTDLIFA